MQRRAARGGERKAPLMTRIPPKTFFGKNKTSLFLSLTLHYFSSLKTQSKHFTWLLLGDSVFKDYDLCSRFGRPHTLVASGLIH